MCIVNKLKRCVRTAINMKLFFSISPISDKRIMRLHVSDIYFNTILREFFYSDYWNCKIFSKIDIIWHVLHIIKY